MLYLIATPIGNLADMTFRAIETLKNCTYVLCEDTRHSRTLFDHYQITTPLKSYHKFNEKSSIDNILKDLKEGASIGLISDAGTPLISDPGQFLVQACQAEDIPVTAIPGPCALVQALICSGLDTSPFQFVGFLPKQASELKQACISILSYPGTSICYESPQRIADSLQMLESLAPDRISVLCRELTKKYEEIKKGTIHVLLKFVLDHPPKGELVLIIAKGPELEIEWEKLPPEEHVDYVEKTYKLTRQEAIKLVAKLRGIPKREIYNLFHQE